MEKDKISEALKSIKDIKPSENFRKNLYLKIDEKIQKRWRYQVIVPERIFALSTAISLLLIVFVSYRIVMAAQSRSEIKQLLPLVNRIAPFQISKIKLSNFSSIHNCINMFEECICLMKCDETEHKCPHCKDNF